MEIRPLSETDAAAVATLFGTVFFAPGEPDAGREVERCERRVTHLLHTDPGGAWAADDEEGRLAGAALSILRDGLWGLSFLAVQPHLQARGLGRRLLEAALGYGDGARSRLILSSTDPKAMRRYARAGLELRPCVSAAGIVDRSRLPAPAPDVARSDDAAATADISRAVRGASHDRDVPVLLEDGMELLLHPGRGFAVHDEGTARLLAARDEAAATDLLWAVLAAARPGATVHLDFVSAHQDWAIAVALEAGLALSPDGPLFVAGDVGPLRPYLPSGSYL